MDWITRDVCNVEFRLLCMMSGCATLISGTVIALIVW